jgi:hypothetical protein
MPELIFYMHDGPATFRFELAGSLAGGEVRKLDQAWRTASSTVAGKILAVDVTFVTSIDEKGRDLLARWRQAGAHFVANSPLSRTFVESITGQPYSVADAKVGPTYEPRFVRAVACAIILFFIMMFPAPASAADLKQETLDAWDQYIHTANAHLIDRTKGTFLWTDESPERLQRVRSGEVLVAPVGHMPMGVSSGLIHHWIGAAFIRGARIEDLIAVVRDYDRYPEYYSTSVVDAKSISRVETADRFSVLVFDKSNYMKHPLDSEYRSRFTELDARKWYSVAQTIRVQEVTGSAARLPDGEGSGYIWRICTLSRYQERDGGVYIETEAIALSRTIPTALHLIVDPIVRRVSRASLTTSLEQTREATGAAAKSASVRVEPRHMRRDAER